MSIKLMSMVFEASELTSTQKLVLLALADYAADDGTSIYPSVETMSRKTALKKVTVHKTLGELRSDEIGLIQITEKYTNRKPNRYQINVIKLAGLIPDVTQKKSRVIPNNTQSDTTYNPRVLPGITNPSVYPPIEPSGEEELAATPLPDLSITTVLEGEYLLQQIKIANDAKGRRSPSKFANPQQRDQFEAALKSLNGSAHDLIVKGIAQRGTALSALGAWLEACAKNQSKPKYNQHSGGVTLLDAIKQSQMERAANGE